VRKFIVIEGLIGVGKTSLCRLLRDEWRARLVLEPAETNPFLELYYGDPDRYAFPVQMFYLMARWRQQSEIRQQDLFSEVVVSDYLFEKDRMFAEKTLAPLEMDLYDHFAGALGAQAAKPDLVVFLDAPIETIMARIAKRQAPGEEVIEPAYLTDLWDRYQALFADWTACPVLRIDNRDMDYVGSAVDRRAVLTLIEAALDGHIAPGSSDREAQPSLFGAVGQDLKGA